MWNQIHNWLQERAQQQIAQQVIAPIEPIDIIRGDCLAEHDVLAQVDVLRENSVIDTQLASDLGLYKPETVNERKEMSLPSGQKKLVDVITVAFTIAGKERSSRWLVLDKSDDLHLVTLGKRDVEDLYIYVQPTQ